MKPPSPSQHPSRPAWTLFALLSMVVPAAMAGTCTSLSGLPFVSVDLADGVGGFGSDAVTEFWQVDCPAGVNPCPGVTPPSSYVALSAGRYAVTYNKTLSGGGSDQCTYDLVIGPAGLQVELSWDWSDLPPGQTVDLDLHVHEPGSNAPWGGNQGNASVCAWDNCTVYDYLPLGTGVSWFNPANNPPAPVNWFLSMVFEENGCYFAPRGIGLEWQSLNLGCHSPRLDIDNIACDATVSDPQDSQYCNPEITNIDFPPTDAWIRVGVHYFSANGVSTAVRPSVKVTCRGRDPMVLGPQGFDAPVTFAPGDGGTLFWLVADVLFQRNTEGDTACTVRPLHANPSTGTPILSTVTTVQSDFGPAYLPIDDLFFDGFEAP